MILGAGTPYYGHCFEEIDQAVSALTSKTVVFNEKHYFKAPPESIIFNLENVPEQVNPSRWKEHEVWDASLRNISRYPKDKTAKHVPVGYHPSMTRFVRKSENERDIDVVFCGYLNERRNVILDELRSKNLRVEVLGYGVWGSQRNDILARSHVALDMRYYEDGIFPALRSLHLIANGIPVVAETSPEMYPWVLGHVPYDCLVERVEDLLERSQEREDLACQSFEMLKKHPLTLP